MDRLVYIHGVPKNVAPDQRGRMAKGLMYKNSIVILDVLSSRSESAGDHDYRLAGSR